MNNPLLAFTRVLDPNDNATGGGAASAVAGAMAAALVGMVARVSVGKKNMPEPDAFYQDMDAKAQALSNTLLDGSNADSTAFDRVMDAFRLPKSTDEEKAVRSAAIQQATIGATETPLQNAANCARALELAAQLEGRSNTNAASDLECAVFLATAGLKGALSNAEINIGSIKDQAVASAFAKRVSELRAKL
jgi:formiminotetrahydrofolate cyclodeaminase